MEFSKISTIIFIIALSVVSAQNVNVNCHFTEIESEYTCAIFLQTIPENPNATFVIRGNHLPGRDNSDVTRVQISLATIPTVIPEIFETFPNVLEYSNMFGGLTRIQSKAFANAGNLQNARISSERDLQSIEANAFTGARKLVYLDLSICGIKKIHEDAFSGLTSLEDLNLDGNQIRKLPANIFSTLTSLERFSMALNEISVLDGRLFAHNPQISTIGFPFNRIKAIGRRFLDGMNQLNFLFLRDNVCIHFNWAIEGSTTVDSVRNALETCFKNAERLEPENELRRFIVEIWGPLKLKFENGTEIVSF